MSDTLNALQTANRTSSVLQAIANPAQVNPLAAVQSGISAASREYDLRQQQANEAAGQAYQGAINPQTGEFDPNEFRRRLAASGPAAMAAGAALLNTQNISSDQLKQNLDKARWVNSTSGALLLSGDFSDAAILGALQKGVAGGILTLPEAQRELATMPADAAGRQRWLEVHRDTSGSYAEQIGRQYGTRPAVSAGGSTEFPEVPAPGRGPAPSVVQTPTTGERYGLTGGYMPLDANGKQTTPDKAVTWQKIDIPRQGVGDMPPPGPAPIVTTPAPGNAPATAPPGALPQGAPPPPPGTRLSGGKFVATPPTTTPPPAVAPRPAAPGVASTPAGPAVITAPPQGQPDLLQKDIDTRNAANLAMEDQQKRLIAGNSALEALKLADTGPSTGFFARAYAFLKAQGITTVERGQLSDTDYRQLLQKNLLRFAQTGAKTSGTDLGLETQIHSNANVDDMLAGANRHVLIQDLGVLKRSIAQTQEMPTSGPAGSVVKHVGEFSANTAPEAFMWNHYTDAERAAIKKDYADKGKLQQLEDSVHLAIRRGAIPPPPPARPAVVAPPAQPPNALVPTN